MTWWKWLVLSILLVWLLRKAWQVWRAIDMIRVRRPLPETRIEKHDGFTRISAGHVPSRCRHGQNASTCDTCWATGERD